MRTLTTYIAVAVLSAPSVSGARSEPSLDLLKRRADQFASSGMQVTLKECNLPKSCGGKPFVKQRRETRETSNDLRVDQRTLSFDGLEIELWYVLEYSPGKAVQNPYRQPSILSVTITKPIWPVAHGLQIGATKEKVIEFLGAGNQQGDCLEYVNDRKQDSVSFCFKANRVTSIQWVPWNDA